MGSDQQCVAGILTTRGYLRQTHTRRKLVKKTAKTGITSPQSKDQQRLPVTSRAKGQGQMAHNLKWNPRTPLPQAHTSPGSRCVFVEATQSVVVCSNSSSKHLRMQNLTAWWDKHLDFTSRVKTSTMSKAHSRESLLLRHVYLPQLLKAPYLSSQDPAAAHSHVRCRPFQRL